MYDSRYNSTKMSNVSLTLSSIHSPPKEFIPRHKFIQILGTRGWWGSACSFTTVHTVLNRNWRKESSHDTGDPWEYQQTVARKAGGTVGAMLYDLAVSGAVLHDRKCVHEVNTLAEVR